MQVLAVSAPRAEANIWGGGIVSEQSHEESAAERDHTHYDNHGTAPEALLWVPLFVHPSADQRQSVARVRRYASPALARADPSREFVPPLLPCRNLRYRSPRARQQVRAARPRGRHSAADYFGEPWEANDDLLLQRPACVTTLQRHRVPKRKKMRRRLEKCRVQRRMEDKNLR